jgi:hypothetical protein
LVVGYGNAQVQAPRQRGWVAQRRHRAPRGGAQRLARRGPCGHPRVHQRLHLCHPLTCLRGYRATSSSVLEVARYPCGQQRASASALAALSSVHRPVHVTAQSPPGRTSVNIGVFWCGMRVYQIQVQMVATERVGAAQGSTLHHEPLSQDGSFRFVQAALNAEHAIHLCAACSVRPSGTCTHGRMARVATGGRTCCTSVSSSQPKRGTAVRWHGVSASASPDGQWRSCTRAR